MSRANVNMCGFDTGIPEYKRAYISPHYILIAMILVLFIVNISFKNFITAGISSFVFIIFIGYCLRPVRLLRSDILRKLYIMEIWAGKKEKSFSYAENGEFQKALDELRTAERMKVTTEMYSNMSTLMEVIGDYKEALEYCEKAIDFIEIEYKKQEVKDMHRSFLYLSKGNLLGKLNKVDEARQYILKSIELDENDPVAYYTLGEVYGLEGDDENSEKSIKKAYTLDPYFPEKWEDVSPYKRYIYRNNHKSDEDEKFHDSYSTSYHQKEESYKSFVSMKKENISEDKIVNSEKKESWKFMASISGIPAGIFFFSYFSRDNIFSKYGSFYNPFSQYAELFITMALVILFLSFLVKHVLIPEYFYIIEKN